MKPICVKCQLFYRIKKSGYYFIEGMPCVNSGAVVRHGQIDAESWRPYKVWVGDLWECRGCGAQIISGTGMMPLAERHHDDFAEVIKRTGAERLQVNDC